MHRLVRVQAEAAKRSPTPYRLPKMLLEHDPEVKKVDPERPKKAIRAMVAKRFIP